MKKARFISLSVIASMVLSFLAFQPVAAAGPSGSWVSGITCQNPSTTTDVSVTFDFYPQGSSTKASSYPDTIKAGGTLKYFTPSSTFLNLPSGFMGSAVVSSNGQIDCSYNTQSTGTGTKTNPYREDTAGGFDTTHTGSSMYIPQVTKAAGWNTYIAIQNTDGTAPVTVDVHYYNRTDGSEVTAAKKTYTIQANSVQVVYLSDNTALVDPFYGSAKVVATSPATTKLAAVVAFYNSGTDFTTAQFQTYNAYSAGNGTLYAARVVRKYYGYNSGLSIQNVGTVDSAVTITFRFGDGSSYIYHSGVIKQNASLILYMPNVAETNAVDGLAMVNRTGSAQIVADAPGASIVGIVNLDNRGNASDNNGAAVPQENIGKGSSTNLSLGGTATQNISFPQVALHASKFSGGVVVQNTEASAGSCTFNFSGVPAATLTKPLPANGQISLAMVNVPKLTSGFNAGVTATCDKAVFGTYNFSIESGAGLFGDSYIEATGFNH